MGTYLNVGCGTHYAQGWVNTDVSRDELTTPDIVVDPTKPYPFEDNHFDAIYLGHVLEHVAWWAVPDFLADMKRIAKPGAEILIVGPDVVKTIQRWAQKLEPWWLVMSALEHQDFVVPGAEPARGGASHHWNCHHDRVWQLLTDAGFDEIKNMFNRIPNDPTGTSWTDVKTKITWPVVGKYYWQFAISCKAPLSK
jgi:SAM-dependent methyltransferase